MGAKHGWCPWSGELPGTLRRHQRSKGYLKTQGDCTKKSLVSRGREIFLPTHQGKALQNALKLFDFPPGDFSPGFSFSS